MPYPPRIQFPNAYYHVFNRGVAKLPIAHDDHDRRAFMSLLADAVVKFQLTLFSYCLMGNHYHLYLRIKELNLDKAVWFLQINFSRFFNKKYRRSGHLFQGRYQSRLVQEDRYSLALVRYIHRNPYEASLTNRLEDYPWSSYACYVGGLPRWQWLNTDWILSQFDPNSQQATDRFRKFHSLQPSPSEKNEIERRKPILGTPAFTRKMFRKWQQPA